MSIYLGPVAFVGWDTSGHRQGRAAVAVAEARACALNALAAATRGPVGLRSRSHQRVITLHALKPATGRRRPPSDPLMVNRAVHRIELARLSHDGDGLRLLNAAQGHVKALVRQVHHAVAVGAQRAGLRGRAGFPHAAPPAALLNRVARLRRQRTSRLTAEAAVLIAGPAAGWGTGPPPATSPRATDGHHIPGHGGPTRRGRNPRESISGRSGHRRCPRLSGSKRTERRVGARSRLPFPPLRWRQLAGIQPAMARGCPATG